MSLITEEIFGYDDYRTFLRDYFQECKANQKFFSHRYFAQKAGFSSSSFFAHVMEGKRNLTQNSLKKMIQGIGLEGRAAAFFESLVKFNQSKDLGEKERWFKQVVQLRRHSKFYKLNKKQWSFYEEWYYPVIRELAVYSHWKGDYKKLAKSITPKITETQAKKAVNSLVEMGLLIKRENGSYAQHQEVISAGPIPPSLISNTKKELLLRAMEASDSMRPRERHISGATLAITMEIYEEICEDLENLRRKVLEKALDASSVDRIYQLNLQLFPISEPIKSKASKGKSK